MNFLSLFLIGSVIIVGFLNFKRSSVLNFYDIFFIYFLSTYPISYINIFLFSNILPNNTMMFDSYVYHKMIIEDSIFFLILLLSIYFFKGYHQSEVNKISINIFLNKINSNIVFFLLCFCFFYFASKLSINENLLRVLEYSELICLSIVISLLFVKIQSQYLKYIFIFLLFCIYMLIAFMVTSGKGYLKDLIVILFVINIFSDNKFFLIIRDNFFKLLILITTLYFLITGLEILLKSDEYKYCYSNCIYNFDLNEFFTPIGASEIINTVRIYAFEQINNINYPIFLSIIENILPKSLYSGYNLETPTLFFEKLYNLTSAFSIEDRKYEYFSGLGLGIVNYFRLFFTNIFDYLGVYILLLALLIFLSHFSTKYLILYVTFYPLFLIALHRLIRTDPVHFINTILFLSLGALTVTVLFFIFKKLILEKF